MNEGGIDGKGQQRQSDETGRNKIRLNTAAKQENEEKGNKG